MDITVKTVQKWKGSGALRKAEERLQQTDIPGTMTQGRFGLGIITQTSLKEETNQARVVAMGQRTG